MSTQVSFNSTSKSIIFNTGIAAIAGVIATVPMTAVMTAFFKHLPRKEKYPLPPREIVDSLAQKAEDIAGPHIPEPARKGATWAGHFAYGGLTGALYLPFAYFPKLRPWTKGIAFGSLVWAGSYLGWLPAARILPPATQHPARRNLLMLASHWVWGMSIAEFVRPARV